jgi:hypothetical protein
VKHVSGSAGFARKQIRLDRADREKHQLIAKIVNYSQGILKGEVSLPLTSCLIGLELAV